MIHSYGYSLFEIESWIPWERDIYVESLRQHIEDENLKMLNRQNMMRAMNGRRR
jgi:hypothetical protein